MTASRSIMNCPDLRPRSGWQGFARGFAGLSLAVAMTLSALAGSRPAIAQTASVGTAAAAVSPADSVLYVGFSLDMSSAQWTLAEELLQRAGAGESGTDIFGEIGSEITGQDGVDIEALLGGEGAFIVTSLEGLADEASDLSDVVGTLDVPTVDSDGETEPTAGGWALVLQPSDLDVAVQQIEEEMTSDPAVEVAETDYNGVTIRSTPPDESTGESGVAYAIVDDFLVLSETPSAVEPFIDTAAGDADPLSDVETFVQADEALAGDRLAFGYLDGTSVMDDIDALDTSGMGLGESLSGLPGVAYYIGMSVAADPAGFRFETVQISPDGEPIESIASGGTPSFAEKVPADSLVMINGFELGAGAFLQGLGLVLVTGVSQSFSTTVDEATPVTMPTAEELYEQAAQLLGFNLKTGFIDQLVGEYGFALWGANAEDPSQIGAILTSSVESPATVADTLSKFSLLIQAGAQGEANVTTRTVGDSNVNTVTIPQDGGDPILVEFGIVDGEFLLGVGDGVEAYLAGIDETLADSDDFQAAMAGLPSEYDGVIYVNVPQAIALGESADFAGESAFVDDPELCGQYDTQEEAQEAFDADPVANFEMDWDFDQIACEDYFAEATPDADAGAETPASAIRSFAGVSYQEEGLGRTSSILIIAEE